MLKLKHKICIECGGNQHFEMVEFFGGQKRFEDIKKNDEIKNIVKRII